MADQNTSSWALFKQSAEDLAVKLAEVQLVESQQMAKEARDLAGIFGGWDRARPTNESRIAAIHQLFDLNRRAMDFLAKNARPPNRPTHPPSSRRS